MGKMQHFSKNSEGSDSLPPLHGRPKSRRKSTPISRLSWPCQARETCVHLRQPLRQQYTHTHSTPGGFAQYVTIEGPF